jgi:hypothetical protein
MLSHPRFATCKKWNRHRAYVAYSWGINFGKTT